MDASQTNPPFGHNEHPDETHLDDIVAAALRAAQEQAEPSASEPGGEGRPSSPKPVIYALPKEYTKLANEAREQLSRSYPNPDGAEEILHRLASEQAGLAACVFELERQLALRALMNMDSPKHAAAITRVLKNVSVIGSTLGKRICGVLATAAVLRSQHRLIEIGPDET